jgi:hypothetical protein
MSTASIQSPEVVHFAREAHAAPAELVLHGLAGVCDALDFLATNLTAESERRERERLVGLALAARVLADDLTHRLAAAPVTAERQQQASERLQAVGAS